MAMQSALAQETLTPLESSILDAVVRDAPLVAASDAATQPAKPASQNPAPTKAPAGALDAPVGPSDAQIAAAVADVAAAVPLQAEPIKASAKRDEAPLPTAGDASDGAVELIGSSAGLLATPSMNVTINLINRLVKRGILTKEEAQDMIRQAEVDTVLARAQAQQDAAAAAQAAASEVVAAAQAGQLGEPVPDDSMQVTYVPEMVKQQIRDEIKDELIARAQEEGWVGGKLPKWVSRMKIFGDIRGRYDGTYYPEGNDNTGGFPDFNAINTGSPYDVTGVNFAPQLNVDQDRQRFRLRVRLGLAVDLPDGFSMGLRLATGDSSSPVSTNQTVGTNGGNFSKYSIWLDRAFIQYQAGKEPHKRLTLTLGRFDNPFFSTEAIYDNDLGFDGVAMKLEYEVLKGVVPFVTAGAFPIFNTAYNFASNQPAKYDSNDKYIYAIQGGLDWDITDDLHLKIAGAYYYFDNIEGQLSDPFTPLSSSDAGNTDHTRPSFAQKGNTYMALRNIVPNALNNYGTTNQYQYYGLATKFRDMTVTGRLDYNHFEPVQISLVGEYIKNLAFDSDKIDAVAVNNRGPDGANGIGTFAGGDTAWYVGLTAGSVAFKKRWDWRAGLAYQYIESDAVVDGLVGSDFGGGGTNLKGYTVFGNLALSPNVWLGVSWMSGEAIAGPPLKVDTLYFDINGKF
jgi:polyhydroxyalkanoate synthesis regulator phasin